MLVACDTMGSDLNRISEDFVSLLVRLIPSSERVSEGMVEYQCEHRDAECDREGMPEQENRPEAPIGFSLLESPLGVLGAFNR